MVPTQKSSQSVGRFIVTGTSGTGKTRLVNALAERGHTVFPEPTRQILEQQLAMDGPALPSRDPQRFIDAMLEHCLSSLAQARHAAGPVFFDRGIPDVAAYALRFGVDPAGCLQALSDEPYDLRVFVLPPWREIFVQDRLRGLSFEDYGRFHEVIRQTYVDAGYRLIDVPRCTVEERVEFVLFETGQH